MIGSLPTVLAVLFGIIFGISGVLSYVYTERIIRATNTEYRMRNADNFCWSALATILSYLFAIAFAIKSNQLSWIFICVITVFLIADLLIIVPKQKK